MTIIHGSYAGQTEGLHGLTTNSGKAVDMSLRDIDSDCLVRVLSFLEDPRDIASLACSCRSLHDFCKEDSETSIWHDLADRAWRYYDVEAYGKSYR